MSNGKKTDLFRFVTLRAPELLSKNRVELGFIVHPNPTSSHFIDTIYNSDNIPASRAILSSKVGSFVTSHTPETIKALNATFWEFSDWLVKHKGNLTRADIDAIGPVLPDNTHIYEIWDNLFYQVLKREDPNVRETCLQLIITINFVQKYTTYAGVGTTDPEILAKEQTDLQRLAEGKVILHGAFAAEKDLSYSAAPFGISRSYKRHEGLHAARIAELRALELKSTRVSLLDLGKTYEADCKAQLDNDLSQYKATVTSKVNQFLSQNPNAEQEAKVSVARELKGISTNKGTTKEVVKSITRFETNLESIIPPGTVESFEFSFTDPLTPGYTSGKLSKTGEDFIAEKGLEKEEVGVAVKSLDKEIKRYEKKATRLYRSKPNEILINGVPVKVNPLGLKDATFSSYEVAPGDVGIYFSMDTDYDRAAIISSTFVLNVDGTDYTSTSPKLLSNRGSSIFTSLFGDNTIASIPDGEIVTLTVTIEFSNGSSFTAVLKGYPQFGLVSGNAIPAIGGLSNPDIHYGVNRIGVADFRRVEQELCGYSPGEVAHIENIMAREYMEQSTRQLTRSTVTNSTETEREKEESLDTTSTSRNEMNTEISEVLDQEQSQSLGFSASASGEKLGMQLQSGLSGDFSQGKSSSDSNSVARTFAEDITKKALERITSKVTSKRKTKLVQELETKNMHGFDNRAGDKHVTGVYRWIDKVYKNRVVNYGKRLIYEFMVPEPSKFYKDAMIIKAEETAPRPRIQSDNSEEILIKPAHPSEFSLANAGNIKRTNYNRFGAEYGIEVPSPPEEFANQSISFGEAIGSTDDEQAFTYDSLIINTDYECTNIQGKVDCSCESLMADFGFVKVSIAGNNAGTGVGKTETWSRLLSFNMDGKDIEGPLPITVSTKKITAFAGSVVAECRLKLSKYEEWQQTVYKAIMDAYEEQMAAYQAASQLAKDEKERQEALKAAAEANKPEDKILQTNSAFNKQRVQTELKRLCIEMLTKPFGFEMGKDFYQNGAHDIPEIKLGSSLDTYASYVVFMEQAFDWDLMAEKFYPYYWAARKDWKSLFQTQDGNDYSFQAFLQSGMGRVTVPVREGFEDAVTYFMETGDIWLGSGLVIDTNDKLYLSLVDEPTNIEGRVEGQEWETIVPTTLRVIQGKSVFLDEEGLPTCADAGPTTLLSDDTILNAEPPTEGGV